MALNKRGKGKRLSAPPVTGANKKTSVQALPLAYESDMQKTIVDWTRLISYKGRKVFDYLHHTPNGGLRNKAEGAKFKAMGVKSGYPDLTIDIVTNKYAGLRIELKRGNQGVLAEEQKDLLKMLNEEGYYAVECGSIDKAISIITRYMNNEL